MFVRLYSFVENVIILFCFGNFEVETIFYWLSLCCVGAADIYPCMPCLCVCGCRMDSAAYYRSMNNDTLPNALLLPDRSLHPFTAAHASLLFGAKMLDVLLEPDILVDEEARIHTCMHLCVWLVCS